MKDDILRAVRNALAVASPEPVVETTISQLVDSVMAEAVTDDTGRSLNALYMAGEHVFVIDTNKALQASAGALGGVAGGPSWLAAIAAFLGVLFGLKGLVAGLPIGGATICKILVEQPEHSMARSQLQQSFDANPIIVQHSMQAEFIPSLSELRSIGCIEEQLQIVRIAHVIVVRR